MTTSITTLCAAAGATGKFETGIQLPKIANESTYFIATRLMDIVKSVCSFLGLEHNENVFSIFYVALVILLSIGIGAKMGCAVECQKSV